MISLLDATRFNLDEGDDLVTSSLSCPECLSTDAVQRTVVLLEFDASVECRCQSCETQWRVFLAPRQALGMSRGINP
jgi:hypothetical protein